jgi:precorrin-6B methylase 2
MRIDRTVSTFKGLFVSDAMMPRRVLLGPLRGLTFRTNLTVQSQFLLGLYETEIHPWLTQLTRGIQSFIDVGAAGGAYTLYGLKRTPASSVITFEPDASSRSKLIENLHLNDLSTDALLLIDKCVGDTRDAHTCTLDDVAGRIQPPCCVKIDIDGGEVKLLQGAQHVLKMDDMRWIIETHSEELEAECLDILHEYEYSTQVVDNAWWRAVFSESRPAHNRWIVGYKDEPSID